MIAINEPKVAHDILKSQNAATIVNVTQMLRTKDFWKGYKPELHSPNLITTTTSIRDPLGELVSFVHGEFNSEELNFITTEVKWLEQNGKSTSRGVSKESTRMVTFGIRFKYGQMA